MVYYMQKLRFCFFLILYFYTNLVVGQAFESKHISFREGLPGRLVLDVYQEESGLIWMLTERGLVRYDGYEFLSLDNFVYSFDIAGTSFQADIKPNAQNKLALLHGSKDLKFELFSLDSLSIWQATFDDCPSLPLAIFTLNNQRSYFAFAEKGIVHLYELTKIKQFQFLFKTQLKTKNLESLRLLVDTQGYYWLNKNGTHLHRYDEKGQLSKKFSNKDFEGNVNNLELVYLFQDSHHRIWTSLKNEKGVFQFNNKEQKFYKLELNSKSEYFAKVWEDKKGNLLFKGARHQRNAYVDDLICLTPTSNQVSFDYLKNHIKTVNDVFAHDFFEQIVVGAANGLTIIKQKKGAFKNILSKSLEPGSWGRSIRGITGDNQGNLFFGTETNELFQFNIAKDSIFQLPMFNIYATEDRKYFGGRNIFLDTRNQIWSLSNNSERLTYFHRYDLNTQETYTQKIEGLTTNFWYDGHRFFYFLTYPRMRASGKLLMYDTHKNSFDYWRNSGGEELVLETRGRSIRGTTEDILWVGTIDGLLKIDLRQKNVELITLKIQNEQLYPSQEILAITEADEGLWLGTSEGLILVDTDQKKIIEQYQKTDGLVDNSVCGIVRDSSNNLWISTFDGLSYFDRKQRRFYNFYESDGLSHYEFNRMAFHQAENGHFYFGGMNGINAFDGQKLLNSRNNNQLVLTKFLKSYADKDSSTLQLAGLDQLKAVILPPNYAYFEFHFAMPNFLSNETRYSAWLENYEKEWNFMGNNPKVRYNKLPAGNYTLHIKAVDAKGNPAKNELKIPINVEEVFYKEIWFQSFIVVLSLFLVWAIGQYHATQELRVERLRTKLSSDLHDEVSGLLAGIAMQTDLMQLSIDDETHKAKLDKIGTTSRSAMSKMGDVIWSVDARKDKFEDLLLRMQEHAAEILQPLGIDYQFEIGKFNFHKKIGLKLRQNLYLIFKESINNIAKHSNASKTVISLQNKDNLFHLSIKDNGHAKSKNAPTKTGQGLSNLKMRTEEIQGKLAIYSKNGYEVHLKIRKFA